MRWLALLLIIPLVSAGTPENPELADDEGDSTGGQGDFLSAWVEQVNATHVDLHATLASLTSQESLRLDVTWLISGPFGGHDRGPQGARVYLQPNQDLAFTLFTSGLGDGLREAGELPVQVTRGEPAMITVQGVPTGGAILGSGNGNWGGGNMSMFSAKVAAYVPVSVLGSNTAADLDVAGPEGEYNLAIRGAYATTPWEITGPPIAQFDGDSDASGPVDVQRAWITANGTGYDFTVEMRSLTHADAIACGELSVYMHMKALWGDRSLGGLSSVAFENGWMSRQYDNHDVTVWDGPDIVSDVVFPFEVRWVFGTPGYFQVHAQDVPFEDWDETPRITVRCDDERSADAAAGSFEVGPILRASILPVFFTVTAGIIAAYYQKKHGRRRR